MSALNFIRSQYSSLPVPDSDFSGKTVVVIGANIGLGLEAARHFVRLNAAKVILGCRSLTKGDAAKADIEATTGRSGVAEVWEVDLSVFESVKSFCKRAEKLERLDVLLENAGIMTLKYTEFEEHESTITVNVISTFLMTLLLIPKLRETAAKFKTKPYVSVVSSDLHGQAAFQERSAPNIFAALDDETAKYQLDRYNVSKLLEVLIVRELATALTNSSPSKTSPIIINSLTPGFCHSDLHRDDPLVRGLVVGIMKSVLARSTEMGSRTLVAGATIGEDSHGRYMSNCTLDQGPSKFVMSDEGKKIGAKVYGELLEILEKVEPGITKNI